MRRVRVKICGMTRPADAQHAVSAGVDAIGMILHADSPRMISVEQAKRIRQLVPPMVSLIGVVVDASLSQAQALYDDIGLDYLQLHGDESAEYADQLSRPIIRAIRAKSRHQVQAQISAYYKAGAFLLDPYDDAQHGGTGQLLARSVWPQQCDKPLILAGGLSPENLADRIKLFQPFAVDLNSGVEREPGIKSRKKIDAAMSVVLGDR